MYSKAIALNPYVPAYWTNRSFAYLKEEAYGFALRDASEAIAIDPSWIKAYYRRAAAHLALQHFKEALRDLAYVIKCRPNDKDAVTKHKQVDQLYKRVQFEKALTYEERSTLVSQTLDVENVIVPPSYTGPRFEGELPDLAFVEAMVETLRQKQKVHAKYVYKLLLASKKQLEQLPSLVDVTVPAGGKLNVCGDTHGQFFDVLELFRLAGKPSPQNAFIFNGDFADRGSFAMEIIMVLFAYKLIYPEAMHLSRGNHEADEMNKMYGFQQYILCCYVLDAATLNAQCLGKFNRNILPPCTVSSPKSLIVFPLSTSSITKSWSSMAVYRVRMA